MKKVNNNNFRGKKVLTLRGSKVLVFGLGLLGGGVATTNWLIKHGAQVTITDLKGEAYLESSLKQLKGKTNLRLNGHDKKDIEDNEIIVFNPDVSINNPFVKYARKVGKQIENEATIFYKLCPRPIVAVTGTRGKTTTSNWSGHFLNPVRGLARTEGASPVREFEQNRNANIDGKSGIGTLSNGTSPKDLGEATSNGVNAEFKAVVSGNSYTEPLLKTLDSLKAYSTKSAITPDAFSNSRELENKGVVVNEIPSYHLEYFDRAIPPPVIAVITNLYQDHLNRHGDMKEYALAKAAIFRNQVVNQHLILNHDNKWTSFFLLQKPTAKVWQFSVKALPKKVSGVFYHNSKVYFQDGRDLTPVLDIDGFEKRWGGHNLQNLLASVLTANLVGVSWEKIQQRILSLPQVPFRQEVVFDGSASLTTGDAWLKIINDTSATSPDGSVAAVARFGGPSTVLISGGTDRELDYKEWGRAIKDRIKYQNLILLSGSATKKMIKSLGAYGKKVAVCETLSECVKVAFFMAGKYKKSVILFSPAAKSFEKFKNEFDRGLQFNFLIKKYVRRKH
ncbi:MAG: Mur ligase family protein [Patescibacteria group bacterium]